MIIEKLPKITSGLGKKSEKNYVFTDYQKHLLKKERKFGSLNLKNYIEKIIYNHILIEKGFIKENTDYY